MIPLSEISRIGKSTEKESKLAVAKGFGGGVGTRSENLMGMGFLSGVRKMLWKEICFRNHER